MGAKNYGIVIPDANIDFMINALVAADFGATGQRCLSTVVFVRNSKPWEEKLLERAKVLKASAGTEPDADLGPVISEQSFAYMTTPSAYIAEAFVMKKQFKEKVIKKMDTTKDHDEIIKKPKNTSSSSSSCGCFSPIKMFKKVHPNSSSTAPPSSDSAP
ncbi:hypothetical protein FXO38_16434 [Capsicum annuum]|nr:hypothetical protein FXO38_16434 [Capsicum annuum]